MNYTGIFIGLVTFLIIGLFHPLVIKGEYYLGTKCWWGFLIMGIGFGILSLLLANTNLSIISGVLSFSSFGLFLKSLNNVNGFVKDGSR